MVKLPSSGSIKVLAQGAGAIYPHRPYYADFDPASHKPASSASRKYLEPQTLNAKPQVLKHVGARLNFPNPTPSALSFESVHRFGVEGCGLRDFDRLLRTPSAYMKSPLISLIILSYIIPYITPFQEFRL